MSVWIDMCTWSKPGPMARRKETYAHMVSDTYEELHVFAAKIGFPRHFFHSKARVHHYDVSSKFYDKAVAAGAFVTSSKDVLIRGKEMMRPAMDVQYKRAPGQV